MKLHRHRENWEDLSDWLTNNKSYKNTKGNCLKYILCWRHESEQESVSSLVIFMHETSKTTCEFNPCVGEMQSLKIVFDSVVPG